jgi:hypothetical protein
MTTVHDFPAVQIVLFNAATIKRPAMAGLFMVEFILE